jgi:uncharacterized SAM-binding protein YcdF (DUF218 family)
VSRLFRNLLLAAAALAVAGFLFRETAFAAMGSYLVLAEEPRKADLALVLGGDSSGNRIRAAGDLVRKGFVSKVVVSGPAGFYGAFECDLAIPYAVRAGYPESYFLHFENHSRSTTEEAREAVKELRKLGARNVLIVTSDFHTRRAGTAYKKAAPEMQFTVVAAPDSEFRADGWWRNREGRKTFVYESMKTVAAWFNL